MNTVMIGNRPVVIDKGRAKCPGCGQWFRGARGVRSHMTSRFMSMNCRPFSAPEEKR